MPTRWLLLRGLARSSGHWFDFPEKLSERLRAPCHPLDLAGTGSRVDEPVPLSVPEIAADVRRRLPATGGAGPWGVLGISLGSMVALALASQMPEAVSRVVLVNGSSRLSLPFRRMRPLGLYHLARAVTTRDLNDREQRVYSLTTSGSDNSVARWSSRAADLAMQSPVKPEVFFRQLVAAARFSPPKVEQPALVLASARDRLVSPKCSARLAAFLEAELFIHPTAGHDLTADDPNWVATRIEQWLALSANPSAPLSRRRIRQSGGLSTDPSTDVVGG